MLMLVLVLMLLSLLIGASYMCYLVLIMTQKDSALATGKMQMTRLLIL